MKKEDLRSVIQDDFDDALANGYYVVHHIFTGVQNRRKCEKYGFLVAIRPRLHDMVHREINEGWSLDWRQRCQRYWEENIGSREEFIREFGRSWL